MSQRRANRKTCDILWSKVVRKPRKCRARGIVTWWRDEDGRVVPRKLKCSRVLQAAHGFSRIYSGTRHDLRNGFCLCSAHHVAYTYDPIQWDELIREWWGLELYEELRLKAKTITKPDYEAIEADLRARL